MKDLKIGIQVYGLRFLLEDTPDQFENVMRRIKAMGYDGVELAGLYGLKPEYIRDTLKEIGLVPISAHVPLADMIADLDKVVNDYATIGVRYMAIPYLPEENRYPEKGYQEFIGEAKKISAALKAKGITLLYHNHNFEFEKVADGTFELDDIYRQLTPDELQTELDLCWVKVAGQDPAAYVRKYSDRCPVVHYKDFIKEGNPKNLYKLIGIETKEEEHDTGVFEFRPVGFGQQIWDPILKATEESCAGWVIAEQDEHYTEPVMECAKRAVSYIRLLMEKTTD